MKKALTAIKNNWFAYLAIAVTSTAISVYGVNQMNAPRNEETISIFCSALEVDYAGLQTDLTSENIDYLREINFYNTSYLDSSFGSQYAAYGVEIADLVIIPESKIDKTTVMYYYARLTNEFVSTNFGVDAYVITEGEVSATYGVKVHSKGNSSSTLIKYENEANQEDFYAFFRNDSLHAGELTNSSYDTSIKLLKRIVNYEN